MKEVEETKKDILTKAALLTVVISLIILIFVDSRSFFGMMVGGLMSTINFYLLSRSLKKAVQFKPSKAGAYVFVQYILRYILWFTVFYIALKRPDVNILTTILGMLTVKLVILFDNFLAYYSKDSKIVEGGELN